MRWQRVVLIVFIVTAVFRVGHGQKIRKRKDKMKLCLHNCALCVRLWENGLYNGEKCARKCLRLRNKPKVVDPDFYPLLICGFEPPTVDTSWSRITGIKQRVSECEINVFLGIPYARAPLDSFRFRPSEPLFGSTMFGYYAGTFKHNCITQNGYEKFMNSPLVASTTESGKNFHPQSEDCLYLNLWSPICPSANKSQLNSVAVFLHPPEFPVNTWDGKSMAIARQQVIVSFNYRSGLFGLIEDDVVITDSGMIHDTRAVLRWIEENVHHFGGDPNRITLLTDDWQSFPTNNIQQLVDQLSEVRWKIFPSQLAEKNGLLTSDDLSEVSKSIGCDPPTELHRIRAMNCLRSVSTKDIIQAYMTKNDTFPEGQGLWMSSSSKKAESTNVKMWKNIDRHTL